MPKYSLSLFAGFDLRDDQGAAVTIRSKKGKCLLAYLALAQGNKVGRDVLAALLWGDRGDTQARRSLSQELYRLRGLFAEEIQDGFVLEAESVGLIENLFEVDVVDFERGLGASDMEAAALYTGELLAGQEANQEGFDEWLRGERERLRMRAVSALHERVRADLDDAPESARRLLALDPANEAAHRALMQLHANAGRRDLALRQYDKCREVLAQELGVEPDGETKALYDNIKSDTPPADAGADKHIGHEALPLPSKPSIAVLPFDNMSDDPEQEYFSDGIADDIITGLSRFRDIFVIAGNSSFAYKGRAVSAEQVGAGLGVRYVLKGGVRKAGKRVRITAQLIEAESGTRLWAERYDGDLSDIFELQDEITTSVVGAIRPTVFLAETERAMRKRPENLDAYEMCMRGWSHEQQLDRQELLEARRYFLGAIELDSRLSSAHVGLASTYLWDWALGWSSNAEISRSEGARAAQRALKIDEADAEAHVWLGYANFVENFEVTAVEAVRAVELSPNNAQARCLSGIVHLINGIPDKALEEIELAVRLSPLGWLRFWFLHQLSFCRYMVRDYVGARDSAMQVIALRPDYPYGHWHLVGSCAQLGQLERAKASLAELIHLLPNFSRDHIVATAPFKNPADLEHLVEGLRKAGWEG